MRAGTCIRLAHYQHGHLIDQVEYVVEEFRHCLGVFLTPEDREAGAFTPLCHLYQPGPDSEQGYIPNYGEYWTNQVPAWEVVREPDSHDPIP